MFFEAPFSKRGFFHSVFSRGYGKDMRYFILLLLILIPSPAFALEHLRLATTTSTDNSGLLSKILPPFEKANDCKVDVIAVGTGKAIKLGEMGDVDVILVHARSKEDQFINDGFGVNRYDVMYNDFVLLGPQKDPARVRQAKSLSGAMSKIAYSQSNFISRGDESGTHTKEKLLWHAAKIKPGGDWYLESGRGMGEVIIMASELDGYTLSDRGTYVAFREKTKSEIVFEGDEQLFNPYGAIMVNPQKHPHVNKDLARAFLNYLISDQCRELITRFRKNGEQLFYVSQ